MIKTIILADNTNDIRDQKIQLNLTNTKFFSFNLAVHKILEKEEIFHEMAENYLTLNYERLIPVLLQAIKELNINNKKLEEKCNDLEKNINQIKKYLI